jgi:hypothetical protein
LLEVAPMRHGLGLLLLLWLPAHAGTSYTITSTSLLPHRSSISTAQYFVQDQQVRAGGPDTPMFYVFKDAKVYVVDQSSKTMQVVTSALVAQAADKMDERVTSLEASAASLPPDRRAILEKMAADLKSLNDSQRLPVPREFYVTDRSQSVDGHACRIWEAFEWKAKRFEFCVAPKSEVPGSADILGGMQLLSSYWQGSIFALGVKLGNAGWWDAIANLKGLPILVREFKDGSAVSETTLTAVRSGVSGGPLFDLPTDYARTEVAFIP